jgi:heme A synthase
MYHTIQTLHSYFAFILLAGLVYSIIHTAMSKNKPFTDRNKKAALIGLISCHLQLLIGLILYFISPLGKANLSGATMKDADMRLLALEHPLTMLLAIVLVTIGYSKSKRAATDQARFKSILTFYGIALVLILSRIPWKTWL